MRKKLDLSEKIKKIAQEGGGKPLLKAVRPEELELEEPKMGHGIEEFELVLEGAKSGVPVVETTKGERLDQVITMQEGKEVKWTASIDLYAEKFASMVREGLAEIKTQPPIFGARFKESSILASHMEGYTFTLASYQTEFEKLVDIFTIALNKSKEKLGHS